MTASVQENKSNFPNSISEKEEASQHDPLTLSNVFIVIVFYICQFRSFVALLKATHAENLHVTDFVFSELKKKAFCKKLS